MLDAEKIRLKLNFPLPITALTCADSTNTLAMALAKSGAISGTTVIAERQTAGRGRLGRTFFSPEGGLYFSTVLRPKIAPRDAVTVTALAAVAVCRALERVTDEKPMIKWVNDIYLHDRKVCGILTEGAILPDTGQLDFAVLGIGLNLVEPKNGYPADIRDKAGAVFGQSSVSDQQKEQLAAAILNEFFVLYRDNAIPNCAEEYRARSYLDSKTVTYEKNSILHTATVIGIDDRMRLMLSENGKTVILEAGEVSVKIK